MKANSRELARHRFGGAIGRTIVDDQNFRLRSLGKSGGDRLDQILASIPACDDDGGAHQPNPFKSDCQTDLRKSTTVTIFDWSGRHSQNSRRLRSNGSVNWSLTPRANPRAGAVRARKKNPMP